MEQESWREIFPLGSGMWVFNGRRISSGKRVSALMNDAQVEISEEYYDDLVEEYGEEFVRYMSQETYNNITIK